MQSSENASRSIVGGNGPARKNSALEDLHPSWRALIRYCRELGYGEIERIKVQDGVPVSAEVIKKKIRWC